MKNQKGFIQIPLLIIIIASIATASVGAGLVLHKQEKSTPFVANVSNVFSETEENTIFTEEPKAEQEFKGTELEAGETKQEFKKVTDQVEKAQNKFIQIEIKNQELTQEIEVIKNEAEAKRARLVVEAEKIKLEAEQLKKSIEKIKKLNEETKKEVETQKEELRETPIIIPPIQEFEPIKNELQKPQDAISESEFIEDEIFDTAPENMEIKIEPEFIVADGKSTSTITVIVKNKEGLPISNQLVIFEFVDRLSQRINTDENGVAMLVYTSDGVKGFKNIGIIADSINKVVQIEEIDKLNPISPTIAQLKSYKITLLAVYYVEREPYDYEESPVYDYEISFLVDTNVPVGNVVIEPTTIGGRCSLSSGCLVRPGSDTYTYKNINVSNIETERYIIFRFNSPETISFRVIITDTQGTVQVDEIYPKTIIISTNPSDNYKDTRLENCIKHRDYQFTELGNCLKNIR